MQVTAGVGLCRAKATLVPFNFLSISFYKFNKFKQHSYKNIYPREQLPASGAGVLRAARGGGGVGHGADGGHGILRLQEGGQDLQGDREVRQTRRAQQQVGIRVIYMMMPS